MRFESVRTWAVLSGLLLMASVASSDAIASSFKIIYAFQGGSDGAYPEPPLINIGGTLYGATYAGGGGGGTNCNNFGCGTVCSITPSGTEKIIYSFQDEADGSNPVAIFKAGSLIVGISQTGSQDSLFSLTTTGQFKLLTPNASLLQTGPAMTKIGKTYYGVAGGDFQFNNCSNMTCGYVYALTP